MWGWLKKMGQRRRQRGVTLVELVSVSAILLVLAG
jgi:prepilin-type N-terminal cleavage/methylation domain-containing protein